MEEYLESKIQTPQTCADKSYEELLSPSCNYQSRFLSYRRDIIVQSTLNKDSSYGTYLKCFL